MNAQFLKAILRTGNEATITKITGTACPCMTSRDSARPQYSAQWHRDNPAAADCLKTGLITRTTTTITVRGLAVPVELANNMRGFGGQEKMPIGEIKSNDMLWQGTVRTDTNAYYDMSALSPVADKITINGIDYHYETSRDEVLDNEVIYQVVLLRRIV